jgi:hypothetical protein
VDFNRAIIDLSLENFAYVFQGMGCASMTFLLTVPRGCHVLDSRLTHDTCPNAYKILDLIRGTGKERMVRYHMSRSQRGNAIDLPIYMRKEINSMEEILYIVT